MKIKKLGVLLAAALFAGCAQPSSSAAPASSSAVSSVASSAASVTEEKETKELRIIGTSDLHGKFAPWDYALNAESTSGSMEQLLTAVNEYRNENTLLVDAGDTIQDNSADIFLDEEVHPMIMALNYMKYDTWTTGNHEYNYGMDKLKEIIGTVEAKVLVGNVYDEDGEPIADGYTIIEKNGLKVAIIGMVTQNITRWDAVNLEKCTVTDPLDETKKILDEIKGQYDVLVGVYHMGVDNEYGVANSGVTDICNACPEFDVMVSSHEHKVVEGTTINGVLVVQNTNMAKTMNVIDLVVEKEDDGWKVIDKTSQSVDISTYEADKGMAELLAPFDEKAREDAEGVIGTLAGGQLSPDNEIAEIPTAMIEDTALIDLINTVQMYYTDAPVSAAALFTMEANMYPGEIHKCDTSLIYKYTNTLYKLHMTGAQLKKFMEWSVSYYNTFEPGDLTISFDENIRAYNYDMFAGVNYEINISNEPGSRIENLTWPDGTPVEDDDDFDIAVNNYRAGTQLLTPGTIYEEGDTPELLELDVRGDIGGVRELIGDYIVNVKGGTITPEVDNNWKITGYEWDEELHQKAVDQLAAGTITIPSSEDGRTPNVKAVRAEDLQ
jgi:2',3'-cyclic-nucleotide 2'-phosphodiesterase/3'-nucleotidase